jgi:hypothetical protein
MSTYSEMPETPADDFFRVDSEERAAWVTNKILGYDEQLARLDNQYKAMRARLEGERDGFRSRWLQPLAMWADANLPKRGKTIHLLTGSLSFRRLKAGAQVVDQKAAVRWAEEHFPEAIQLTVTKRADAECLRAHFEETGEIPPGVLFKEERDEFYVRAAKVAEEEF